MATTRYTDLDCEQGEDGLFDLIIDETTRDFVVADGLEGAIITSLFSDRRAREDEVTDPMKRRGWIGDLVAEVPADRFGSGLWLYEQHRMTADVAAGVRSEAEQALDWMVGEELARSVAAKVTADPANRRIYLHIDLYEPTGGGTTRAYLLADRTRNGRLAAIGAEPARRTRTPARDTAMEWDGETLVWDDNTMTWE